MEELFEAGGSACSTDQILYNLGRRGPEHDLLPWLTERRVPAMAYSPVEQGRLLSNPVLRDVAERMKTAPAQVALAWALRRRDVIVIPKASSIAHVRENRAAADLELTSEEIDAFDRAFPGPRGRVALEML